MPRDRRGQAASVTQMSIQLYDSLERRTRLFEPRDPGRVAMYCCGPTVYNYIHIGNARTFVWFDQIRRYFEYRGFDVVFVMNYTDVDDKIIDRAKIEKLKPEEVAQKYAMAFEKDMGALGFRPADKTPRAVEHIPAMVDAIQGLIDRGLAYVADGNVWFAVEKFPDYGKLSGRTLDDMRAGERIEPHPSKAHPLDFGLWKAAKEDEPSWESPWGPGRPGWHIECSVMSEQYLGQAFDLHGGGSDLIFPHHENEIAQAEGLTGSAPFARHWLHAGMVQMESEKMSKSLGNVVLASEVVERYPAEVVRYWMLQSSYRNQSVFSGETLDDAKASYERWWTFFTAALHALGDRAPSGPQVRRESEDDETWPGYVRRFVEAMDDDFNSAEAFAVIHDLVREANKRIEDAQRGDEQARADLAELTTVFLELTGVFGFDFARAGADEELTRRVEDLLQQRERAREQRDFTTADEIRDTLTEMGVVIDDTPSGPRWHLGSP